MVSILSVLIGLVVMSVFLIRLIYQDIADGGGQGVTKINLKVPQTVMTRVEIPFTLTLEANTSTSSRVVVKLSSRCSYIIKYFWAVPISTFHHGLRSPWSWFYSAAVSRDTCNLFGGSETRVSQCQAHEEMNMILTCPRDLDLGQAPRDVYPLVVILVKTGSEDVENNTEVTSLINIIHIRDATCPIPSQILATYIRQGGGLTQLRPLFVSDSGEAECSDTESAEDSETEDWPSSSRVLARCVVCQIGRVNRVVLPCRHASTCAACFDRLQARCPMCRGFISSYFLLFPDPAPAPTLNSSDGAGGPPVPAEVTGRSWRTVWRDWNVRFNAALGLQEN